MAPFITGVVLGAATDGLMAPGGVRGQRGKWAATRVARASFYVVFALPTGNRMETVLHTGLAAGFVSLAIVGARGSSWMLAAALLGYGMFDMSVGSVVPNPAPDWWGPFFIGFDVVLAFALAALLWRRKTVKWSDYFDAFCKSPINSPNLARCSSGSPL